jgi:hypothetical protein
MFLVGSPGREIDDLCEEAAFAPHAQLVVTSVLPGDQYASNASFWLFAVVKVLLLIYKCTEEAQSITEFLAVEFTACISLFCLCGALCSKWRLFQQPLGGGT